MKRNLMNVLLVMQCLLAAASAQITDCKTDRARFIAHDDRSLLDSTGKDFKTRFDQIATSFSQLIAEITVRKLNAAATISEITSYLRCVTNQDYNSADMRELTNAPAVLIPQTADPPRAIVATYTIPGHSTDKVWGIAPSRPLVQCFAKTGNRWVFVGETGNDFNLSTLFIYPLSPPVSSETWILLAGRHIGDTGGRLRLEVVTCDGKTLKSKWSRDGMRWGQVQVDGNGVVLSYEKREEQGRIIMDGNKYDPAPARFTEVLHVTPNGLE